jgi:hypothetical protein
MKYNEFITAIDSLDASKIHIVRVPMTMKQEQLVNLQKALKQLKLTFLVLPDFIKMEELTQDQLKYLLGSITNEKNI